MVGKFRRAGLSGGVLGGSRGVFGGGGNVFGLSVAFSGLRGVDGLSLVPDIGNETAVIVSGVSHDLDSSIGEIDPVGA